MTCLKLCHQNRELWRPVCAWVLRRAPLKHLWNAPLSLRYVQKRTLFNGSSSKGNIRCVGWLLPTSRARRCAQSNLCRNLPHTSPGSIGYSKCSTCTTSTSNRKLHVAEDDILSEENKKRVQNYLSDNMLLVGERGLVPSVSPPKKRSSAAVLVPLCTVAGTPSVLFTLRSTSLRRHRGQVSFPGGKMDDTDEDVVHTALRETEEELGIGMDTVDVWGTLMEMPSREDTKVIGVIGCCGEIDTRKLTLNEDEVDLVFTVPIKALCDGRNIGQTQFRTGRGYSLPVYLGAEHRIWGLTAVILHHTLTILAPGLYRYKLRHRS